MAFTYDSSDLSSNQSRVRLMIGDTVSANAIFQDAEIDAFLSVEGDSVKRGAAAALMTMAANQVYVLKVIENMDLKTDGAAVARELRQQAGELRSQAADEEANEEGGAFDIAEWVVDDFSSRERLYKEMLRS